MRKITIRGKPLTAPEPPRTVKGPYQFLIVAYSGEIYGCYEWAEAMRQCAAVGGIAYAAEAEYSAPGAKQKYVSHGAAKAALAAIHAAAIAASHPERAKQPQRSGARLTARQRALNAKLAGSVPGAADLPSSGHHRRYAAEQLSKTTPTKKRRSPKRFCVNCGSVMTDAELRKAGVFSCCTARQMQKAVPRA